MAKHRKHKRDYDTNYEQVSPGNGINLNNLSSILGNIDINQIASLLNATGILGNSGAGQSEENGLNANQRENSLLGLNNIDFGQLLSQANVVNSMIMSNNEDNSNENRERHSKSKSSKYKEEEIRIEPMQESNDPVVVLLNAIKPMIAPDRALIIEKIVDLYVQGKI